MSFLKHMITKRTAGPLRNPFAYWTTAGVCISAFVVPLRGMERVPHLCIFHRLTGLPCPGCGLSRSLVAFAHFEWHQALAFHLFGPLFFLVCLLVFALSTAQRFWDVPIPWDRMWRIAKWPTWTVAVAWLAWAAHRAWMVAVQ